MTKIIILCAAVLLLIVLEHSKEADGYEVAKGGRSSSSRGSSYSSSRGSSSRSSSSRSSSSSWGSSSSSSSRGKSSSFSSKLKSKAKKLFSSKKSKPKSSYSKYKYPKRYSKKKYGSKKHSYYGNIWIHLYNFWYNYIFVLYLVFYNSHIIENTSSDVQIDSNYTIFRRWLQCLLIQGFYVQLLWLFEGQRLQVDYWSRIQPSKRHTQNRNLLLV